jgi:cob(I)alamin adenosyltransferase
LLQVLQELQIGGTKMVVLNKIYTRTGDDGTSAMATGERRLKSDPRFEAIGTIDELNASIGIACLHNETLGADLAAMLTRIQNDLFDLGADLATPDKKSSRERLRITAAQVERLEREIDALNAELAPLTSFVLPGGTPAAATFHFCRTVARRAERTMVALAAVETVNPEALRYVNRLSDLLFVAARIANDNGARDVLWVPGENR